MDLTGACFSGTGERGRNRSSRRANLAGRAGALLHSPLVRPGKMPSSAMVHVSKAEAGERQLPS
jgi:hypothetical protein